MATTETTAFGDGTTILFGFPFPYLKTEDIKVELQRYDSTQTSGNEIISRQTISAFTIPSNNPTAVQFSAVTESDYQESTGAPKLNFGSTTDTVRVRVFRFTDADSIPSTFIQGSSIRAQDLNNNFEQTLYIMQERQNTIEAIQLGGIGENVISTSALQDDAVTADKLRDSIADDTQRSVTTNHIRNDAITTAKIINDAVTTDKIINDAVTADKLKDSSSNDAQRSVTTNHIRNDAVTADKLRDSSSNDAQRSVTTNHIRNNAITTAKILDANVTPSKLDRTYVETTGDTMTGALKIRRNGTDNITIDKPTTTSYGGITFSQNGDPRYLLYINNVNSGDLSLQCRSSGTNFKTAFNVEQSSGNIEFNGIKFVNKAGTFAFNWSGGTGGVLSCYVDGAQKKLVHSLNNNITLYWNPFSQVVGRIDGVVDVVLGSGSDYRLKENVSESSYGTNAVKALRPVTYNFKGSPNASAIGFIAHEAAEAVPGAATGEKDGEMMQSINTYPIVATLTKALQESIERIETLEAKVQTLENN